MAASKNRVLLNKDALVEGVSKVSGETKAATVRVLDAVPNVVIDTILKNLPKGDEVVAVPIPGFGTLGVKHVDKCVRMNNITKQEQVIPAHYVPTFKISRAIKVELNPDTVKAAGKKAASGSANIAAKKSA